MTEPPTEVRRRLTLPDRIKAARQDEAAEKAQGGPESAPEAAQASDNTVTLPVKIWRRLKELAELGERVEKGEFKTAAVVDEALNAVEQLRQQMHLALQHRRPLGTVPEPRPRDESPEAQAAPATAMDGYIAALRRPRG